MLKTSFSRLVCLYKSKDSPYQWGSTMKGKNLLLWKQILSFQSRPLFGRIFCQRSEKEVTKNGVKFVKMMEKNMMAYLLMVCP